ncbi:MAG: amino acid adenylation domain-containing protein [Bacteroidia bacterium]
MSYNPVFIPVDYDPFAGEKIFRTAPTTEPQREIFTNILIGGDAANCAYNESVSLKLKGDFDFTAFKQAVDLLIQRHEALRASFSKDGMFIQVAHELRIQIPFSDLSSSPGKDIKLKEELTRETNTPFDLENGPLIRVSVFRLGEKLHNVVLTLHHIVGDGWSLGVCMIDLSKFYTSIKNKSETRLEAADSWVEFAIEEEKYAAGSVNSETENYWIKKYSGDLPVMDLPVNKPRPPLRTFNAQRIDIPIPSTAIEKLKIFGSKSGASLVNTLTAAFEVFLYRLTGNSDVVVGLPTAGQSVTGKYNLVGHCVNLLPLRTTINPEESFSGYLKERKKSLLDDFDHQRYTFGSLIQKLNIPRDPARIPLVPVTFNIDVGITNGVEFAGLEFEFSTNPRGYENFEWFINCSGSGNSLVIECTFNTDLFEKEMMQLRMEEFCALLDNITENPDQKICYLTMLPGYELNRLLIDWNNNFFGLPEKQCIHFLFEERVKEYPGKIALRYNGQEISYIELNSRANMLAHYLRKNKISNDVLVGICIERSVELIVAMLAVLKAGGAYVPLDPSYPADRITFILDDSNAPVLITTSGIQQQIKGDKSKVILIDKDRDEIEKESRENPAHINKPSDLAYIIYTSGSTGKPKGVSIEHKSDIALFEWGKTIYSLKDLDGVLASTSVCFDLSIFEIFFTITSGGRIVLVKNALELPELSREANVKLINTVPSAITELLKIKNGIPTSVKIINLAGEPLPAALVNKIYDNTKAEKVFDLYGPSEDTTYSTFTLRKKNGPYTVGKAINNSQLYLLDKFMQPVPIGVAGEIYIGGEGLARGYLNRPELTAEKFVPNPFSIEEGSRLYKTGDLGKFIPDGNIEFLGRIDNQVKLRGYRIELGEVESVLHSHPKITEHIVMVKEDSRGDKKLVAWLVADSKHENLVSEIRSFLKDKLPEFMIPSVFVLMDKMPMTPNGKIDRKALPDWEIKVKSENESDSEILLQQSSTEESLVDIWKEILNISHVGIKDNFFELGGHSLIGVRMFIEIENRLGVKLNLQSLFKAPTIEELAKIIDKEESTIEWKPLVALQPNGTRTPLFCIHMHNGNIYRWKVLEKYLPHDQPVYAIQPRGLDEKQKPHRNIEEMAKYYIDIIREVQPHGPYNLAGLCFGGMVVFEMALQLQAQGEKVALAAMVNNYAPLENQTIYRMRKEFSGFMKMGFGDKINYAIRKNISLGKIIKNKALNIFGKSNGGNSGPADSMQEDIRFIHTVALMNYNPVKVYKGDLFIIRTGGAIEDSEFYDASLGWKRLVKGKVEVLQVEGSDNDTIIEEEQYNTQLALFLKDKLDEVWKYKEETV